MPIVKALSFIFFFLTYTISYGSVTIGTITDDTGGCNGAIELDITQGETSPYTYAWTGPSNFTSTNTNLNNLCAGLYTLIVTNSHGCERFFEVEVDGETVPDSPTNLEATVASLSSVDLTWVDNSDNEDYFKIFRKVGTGGWTVLTTVGANVTDYTDTGLAIGVQYCYKVRAFNSLGGSLSYTNVGCVSIETEVPDTPSELIAKVNSSTSIRLDWTDNSDNESFFRIFRKVGSGSWSVLIDKPANSTAHIDTDVVQDVEYCYKVRAFNFAGGSISFTNTECLIIHSALPQTPTDMEICPDTPTSIELTWVDNSEKEDYFKVFRKIDSGPWLVLTQRNKNVTSFTDTGLTQGVNYCYRVRAFNTAGASTGFSNTACTNIPTSVPATPTNTQLTLLTATSIQVEWTDNATNECYTKVFRKRGTESWKYAGEVGKDETSFVDMGLTLGTEYCYRVRSFNAVGGSATFSNTFCETTSPTARLTSVEGFSLNKVYPNPFSQHIMVDLESGIEDLITVKLVNTLGQKVYESLYEATVGVQTIRVNPEKALPVGIYYLELTNGQGEQFVKRVVKGTH